MSKQLEYLSRKVVTGVMSRREFFGRAAALGFTAAFANTLLATASRAAPQTGGTFRMGLQGGSTTDSLDPALAANQVALMMGRLWGEPLVALTDDGGVQGMVAESFEGSADASVWRFKIRNGITFSNGQAVTAEDAAASLMRHAGEESKSGALPIELSHNKGMGNGEWKRVPDYGKPILHPKSSILRGSERQDSNLRPLVSKTSKQPPLSSQIY